MSRQTNQHFTVYVGNDGGQPGLKRLVDSFRDQLDIVYHYFENNLGAKSLVSQWNRCFALTNDEEWLWLLPDDDYLDPNCVELFYKALEGPVFDLFRFNVKYVNANGTVFKTNPLLNEADTSYNSLIEKLSFFRSSSVAEFIFPRHKLLETGGFKDLPLAWGSDDLFWFEAGACYGIRGTNEAYVYLRHSGKNISSDYSRLGKQKVEAGFLFFHHLMNTVAFRNQIQTVEQLKDFRAIAIKHVMYNLQDFGSSLSLLLCWNYAKHGQRIWGGGLLRNFRRFWLINKKIRNNELARLA